MERVLRNVKINAVSKLTAPECQVAKFTYRTADEVSHMIERSVGMYYVTFVAYDEYEKMNCVIMNPNFKNISDISNLLCNYMETGKEIAVISGSFSDGVLDVAEIIESRFTFY